MMIRLIIHGADALAMSQGSRRERVHQALKNRIDFLLEALYEKIIGRLSGGVLQRRSGKLIESIRIERASDYRVSSYQASLSTHGGAGSLSGYVTQDMRTAPYGGVQEYGGTHPFTLAPRNKEYMFFLTVGAKVTFLAQGKKKEFIRGRSAVFTKKPINRRELPSRSYMRSSLNEMSGEIGTGIKAVVRDR